MHISRVSQCFTMMPAWEARALPLGDTRARPNPSTKPARNACKQVMHLLKMQSCGGGSARLLSQCILCFSGEGRWADVGEPRERFSELLGEACGCGLWDLWRIMEENLPRHRANNRKARQETSIMHACAAEGPLSGKISLKCTLGQPILARMAYFVLFKMGKRCRGVHLANISPERSGFLARAYIMLVSCHSVTFCPPCGCSGY